MNKPLTQTQVNKLRTYNKRFGDWSIIALFVAMSFGMGMMGIGMQLLSIVATFLAIFVGYVILDEVVRLSEHCSWIKEGTFDPTTVIAVILACITSTIFALVVILKLKESGIALLSLNFTILLTNAIISDLLDYIVISQSAIANSVENIKIESFNKMKQQLQSTSKWKNTVRYLRVLANKPINLTVIEKTSHKCPHCGETRMTKDVYGHKSFVCGYFPDGGVCLGKLLSQHVTRTII